MMSDQPDLLDVGQPVVVHREDAGLQLHADPVTGAEVLIDPNLELGHGRQDSSSAPPASRNARAPRMARVLGCPVVRRATQGRHDDPLTKDCASPRSRWPERCSSPPVAATTTTRTTPPTDDGGDGGSDGGAYAVDTGDCPDDATEPIEGTVKIGTTLPLSGGAAAAAFAPVAEGLENYIDYANENDLVPGYEIELTIEDDQYNPNLTTPAVEKLIDETGVNLFSAMIGTPNNQAVRDLLNEECYPQLFANSGAPTFGDVETYPWTLGGLAPYNTETADLRRGHRRRVPRRRHRRRVPREQRVR